MKIIASVFLLVSLSGSYASKVAVCYYGTWATYRWGLGQFSTEHINPNLCTHLVYTFVGINSDGTIISLDPYLDLPDNWGRDNFRKFNSLKQKNNDLKTLLAVGGWGEGSAKYSVMAADPNRRQNFIKSALQFVLNYGFDGLDIDWEYPNRRDSVHGAADVDNFVQLLKELKQAFNEHGLLLTVAVAAVEETAKLSYNIPEISKYVDYISIMAYDFYGGWDTTTGHNSALHRSKVDENTPRESFFTVDVTLEFWLKSGCPPEKLVLGLPFYARSFILTNENIYGVRAPSSGYGISGPYTATSGFLGYNELCDKIKQEGWKTYYDDYAGVPYAVQGKNWVSYDDPNSIAKKIEYGLSLGIGGVMVWSIETDDLHGICHGVDFPLLRAINEAIGRFDGNSSSSTQGPTTTTGPTSTVTVESTTAAQSTSPSSTTTMTTTTTQSTTSQSTSEPTTSQSTTEPTTSQSTSESTSQITSESTSPQTSESPTTPDPDLPFCNEVGLTYYPKDCSKFVYCIYDANGNITPIVTTCPDNLLWDRNIFACNYADLVKC